MGCSWEFKWDWDSKCRCYSSCGRGW